VASSGITFIPNFIEIHLAVLELLYLYGRMDGRAKRNKQAFRNGAANVPRSGSLPNVEVVQLVISKSTELQK
jgi:hypothetical protein